jgi:hypothetical protein
MQRVGNICLEMGRNEACYGHPNVSAVLTNPDAIFEARGDIINVMDIQTLVTRPLDLQSEAWGIVMMDVQADLPENADASVRLLVFGGTEIVPVRDRVVLNRPSCQVTNDSRNNLNLRAGPGEYYPVVDIFDRQDSIYFYGRNADSDWMLSARGWVFEPLTANNCAMDTLPVIANEEDSFVAPMQAFTLRMDEDAQCNAAPTGMLVQAPTGRTANLRINDVDIRIGSTALIRIWDDGGWLGVANLEGSVQVRSHTFTRLVPLGAELGVPLENGQPDDIPSEPWPIHEDILGIDVRLMELLPEALEMPDPWVKPVELDSASSVEDDDPIVEGEGPPVGSNPGGWGACGSCDTCGHAASECRTNPEGACVWDPGDCLGFSPGGSVTVPQPSYTCPGGVPLTVTATYFPPDEATIASHNASSSSPAFSASTAGVSESQFNVVVDCLTTGTGTIFVNMVDSKGRQFSTSFGLTN